MTSFKTQQNILIIGVLFPTISLMMINFSNRFTVTPSLIHDVHTMIYDNTSLADAEHSFRRLNTLHKRLRLIDIVQTISALAFGFVLLAIITPYLDAHTVGS